MYLSSLSVIHNILVTDFVTQSFFSVKRLKFIELLSGESIIFFRVGSSARRAAALTKTDPK